MAIKLTPDQFVAQWKNVNGGLLNKNAHNFVVAATVYTKNFFKASFAGLGFGWGGTPWTPRRSKWGLKKSHRLMNETGDLKNSIQHKTGNRNWNNTKNYMSGTNLASAEIFTTASNSRKKMGDRSGYSAIHNSDPTQTNYTVGKGSSKKVVQRQFIGFNRKTEDTIAMNFLARYLLDGIPH